MTGKKKHSARRITTDTVIQKTCIFFFHKIQFGCLTRVMTKCVSAAEVTEVTERRTDRKPTEGGIINSPITYVTILLLHYTLKMQVVVVEVWMSASVTKSLY